MKIIIALVLLLTVILAVPGVADTTPSIVADVNIVGNLKVYNYSLTNNSDDLVYGFGVFMPEAGARTVNGFTCSKSGWFETYSFRDDCSMWRMGATSGNDIHPGETVVFTLTTPADVPTGYNYKFPGCTGNWYCSEMPSGSYYGSYSLPVPVPEPSSIFALLGGLAGVGGFAMRRRRR